MNSLANESDEQMDATVFREQTVLRDESSLSFRDQSVSTWSNRPAPGSASGDAYTPRLLKQRFVLEELIGTGGMGSVYRAKDLRKVEARDAKPYLAVKVLNNDFRKHPEAFIALEREASKSQGLRHSNIVSIFDFDKDGDVPFITMELLEGIELAELLRDYPNGLPEDQAWHIIQGVVRGLAHAHEEEVVHADFKPGNVYVTERQSKILDFGIARAMRLNRAGEDTDFDPARLAALTPAYASREMLNGDNPEPRDDLYSLGVVMYLVLTGHHPFGRLPADKAAAEGLEPERIRHISRRRWRALKQCLQFNRQNRPANAGEVYEALFGRPLWQTWGVAAGAAAIALGALLFTMQEQAELDEVKQEVRKEALVDAQVARIGALLQQPQFDEDWQRTLYSEARTLRDLAASQPVSGDVLKQIEQVYVEHVRGHEDVDLAFAQLEVARHFGEMPRVEEALRERLLAELDALSSGPISPEWLNRADAMFGYAQQLFAPVGEVVAARQEVLDHLQDELKSLVDRGQTALAQQAWQRFGMHVFDEELWTATERRMQQAVATARQRELAAAERAALAQLEQQLDGLLGLSCLRLDLEQIGARLTRLQAANPAHGDALRARVGSRIGHCVTQLAAVDPARGESLQRAAKSVLGTLPALDETAVDPCALHYLAGNGRRSGPGGYCTDLLRPAQPGPQLVVVPGAGALDRFAISKFAVSWAEMADFCAASELCAAPAPTNLPARGLTLQQMSGYAGWLSQQTGRTYRLPTAREWSLAVAGVESDGARCAPVEAPQPAVQAPVSQGQQNRFGLVFPLAWVSGWVMDGNQAAVVSSAVDPSASIEPCLMDAAAAGDGEGVDFRLVRELS